MLCRTDPVCCVALTPQRSESVRSLKPTARKQIDHSRLESGAIGAMRIQKRRPLLNRSEHVFCEGVFTMLQQPDQDQEEEEEEQEEKVWKLQLPAVSFPSPKTGDRPQLDTINIRHPFAPPPSAISGVSSPPPPPPLLLSLEYAWHPADQQGHLNSLALAKEIKTVNSSSSAVNMPPRLIVDAPLQQKHYLGFDLNLSLSSTSPQTSEFTTFATRPPFYMFTELFKGTRGGLVQGTENMGIGRPPALGFEAESELMLNQMGKVDAIYSSVEKIPAKRGFSSYGNGNLHLEGKGEGKEQCKRKDGRGWQCSRRVKEDCTYCEHHLLKIRANHARSAMKMALLRNITKTKKKKKKLIKLEDCHCPPPPLLNHFM